MPSSAEPLPRQRSKPAHWPRALILEESTITCRAAVRSHMWELFRDWLSKPTSFPVEARRERKWLSPNLRKQTSSKKEEKGLQKSLLEETFEGADRCKLSKGARKSCHLLAVWDMPATGLVPRPTISMFNSHQTGECHHLHLQMGNLRLGEFETLTYGHLASRHWARITPVQSLPPADRLPRAKHQRAALQRPQDGAQLSAGVQPTQPLWECPLGQLSHSFDTEHPACPLRKMPNKLTLK